MRRPLLAVVVVAGCAVPPGAPSGATFNLPTVEDAAAQLPVSDAGRPLPSEAPPSAPPLVAVPVPVVTPSGPAGASGGGGSSGGPGGPAPLPDLVGLYVQATLAQVTVGPDGWGTVTLPPGTRGAVSLAAPGYVASTVVIDRGELPAMHPRPREGEPQPMGLATIAGTLGSDGADLVVAYRSARLFQAVGATADATGAFSFAVPLDGTDDGVVVASSRGSNSPLGLVRVHVEAGRTTTVTGLAPAPPEAMVAPPGFPAGLLPGASSLVLLAEGLRVDLVGYPGTSVPRYPIPGFTLAASFDAERQDHLAGSTVLAGGDVVPPFLAPPEVDGVPDQLAPGLQLSWPAVPEATLYTLRLQRFGDALPLWEGATASPRIMLPPDLPPDQADMELELDAWASEDVTLYGVASVRQLRIPRAPAAVGGRRSWALRKGLGS
jgi:hypothetical protein